jgi:hypothetical protein
LDTKDVYGSDIMQAGITDADIQMLVEVIF